MKLRRRFSAAGGRGLMRSMVLVSAAMVAPATAGAPLKVTCDTFPATGSRLTVQKTFGASNLSTEVLPIPGGEGEETRATVLFAKNAARRAVVVWMDTIRQDGIARVEIYRPVGSPVPEGPMDWQIAGVRVGSTLAEVEAINGKPFHLNGFDFDGGGVVRDWQNGRLAKLAGGCTLTISFEEDRSAPVAAREATSGDQDFLSNDPSMRASRPRVQTIRIEPRK